MKIKNQLYRDFLDNGVISMLGENDILKALENITETTKHAKEGRALLITLYYTGARPNEVLNLKGKDFKRTGNYLIVSMPSSKGGVARPIYLSLSKPMVKELHNYIVTLMPEILVFFQFRNKYTRLKTNRKGNTVISTSITDKLRYYFKRWFPETEIPPYYLRHNRFSKLSEKGLTPTEIMQIKGAKSIESVRPYLHLSTHTAKKISRKLD